MQIKDASKAGECALLSVQHIRQLHEKVKGFRFQFDNKMQTSRTRTLTLVQARAHSCQNISQKRTVSGLSGSELAGKSFLPPPPHATTQCPCQHFHRLSVFSG